MDKKRIVVVGAGPAGCTAARLLAELGHDVSLFEEHEKVGVPIQCTGIVTETLFEFVDKKDLPIYQVNELRAVRIISPNGTETQIPLKEYVICREKFDSHLCERARDAGAKIATAHKFVRTEGGNAVFKTKAGERTVPFDVLIGADGPNSMVARDAGLLPEKREFLVGNQVTLKGKFAPHTFTTFFGNTYPKFFGWVVPESETHARVGFASRTRSDIPLKVLLERFGGEIVERQGGVIPIYKKRPARKGNVYLVGDAAGLVKNTTGGGIITGIWSAHRLAESLKTKRSYNALLRPLRRELWLHRKLRGTLDAFSEQDYDRLVELMSDGKVKHVLNTTAREYPSRILLKLAVRKPQFARFVPKLFAKAVSTIHTHPPKK